MLKEIKIERLGGENEVSGSGAAVASKSDISVVNFASGHSDNEGGK